MAMVHGYDERPRGSLSLYGALSLAFIFVLLVQLCRSIAIDTYGLTGTRIDLAGFAFCHLVGAVLVLRALMTRRLMVDLLILGGLLITYIAIIVQFTGIDASLLSTLLSRYGILSWFLLGVETAAAASFIHLPMGTPQARAQGRLFLVVAAILAAILVFYSLTYLSAPVFTLSYQSVADNLMVILLSLMIFSQVIWRGKVPLAVVIGLLAVGTLAVTAVARLQSTAIVGFWIVALVVYFWSALSRLKLHFKVLGLAVLAGGLTWYVSSDLFTQTLRKTRFAEVVAGEGLSSINSRLELLHDFWRQFAISPIFGNFAAEVHAGSGFGNYPHTLLSFLTHTGVFGTTILGVVLGLIVSRRLPLRRLPRADLQQLMFLIAVLALGALFTFMTWSVFWFMLGFMCKTPSFKAPGEAE